MNETSMMTIFDNPEFGQVRTVTIDGEPWFAGKDVAVALGYKDTVNAIKTHVDGEDKKGWRITTPSGEQTMTIINESGMYSLILSSKLPTAKEFKRWVTSEVLPSVRKTGAYMTSAATEQLRALLTVQQELIAAQQDKLDRLEHYVVKIGKNLNLTNYLVLREFGTGTKSGWKSTVTARLRVIEDATSISQNDQLRSVYTYMRVKYGARIDKQTELYKLDRGFKTVSTLDVVADSKALRELFDMAMSELFDELELQAPEIECDDSPVAEENNPFSDLVAMARERRRAASL